MNMKALQRGFTLIELLIVIVILGILAAATLTVLDPVDKIFAGNDSKVQSDITNIAKAAEAFAVTNNGTYPTGLATLVASGDMKSTPAAPGGYSAYNYAGTATSFIISGQLRSKKYAATPFFKYTSNTGKACAAAAATGDCP
jgi:prepilin-type N-terminal cleavage/methylation domain-containing protein